MSTPPTVLLLHSFGSAGRSWDGVRAALPLPSQAPDLPGFGAEPPLPAPSVAAYADWVLQRLPAGDGEVMLAGASMGGKIAMAVAAREPSRFCGLLLCAPSPPTAEPMEEGERARQLRSHGDPAASRESVAGSMLASPDSGRFREALNDWLRTDTSAWRWWWSEGSRETLDVSTVDAPTQVLVGRADDHLGADVQRRETLPRLRSAELSIIEGAGHLVGVDQPEAVASALAALARPG